ncbi:MAG TPA: peroxiredoxin, partial [Woeseiaceae bacterium]
AVDDHIRELVSAHAVQIRCTNIHHMNGTGVTSMHRVTLLSAAALLLALLQSGALADQVTEGDTAPGFELRDQDGKVHTLEDYRDSWVALYFYPKNGTPGCTTEACEFRDNIFAFNRLGCQILGVSLDDEASHKAFAEKHGLPFPLLADTDGVASGAYGVKTRLFGMSLAKRQTFLIGPDGRIARHYEKVDPATHSQQVLADLESLIAQNEQ